VVRANNSASVAPFEVSYVNLVPVGQSCFSNFRNGRLKAPSFIQNKNAKRGTMEPQQRLPTVCRCRKRGEEYPVPGRNSLKVDLNRVRFGQRSGRMDANAHDSLRDA
jgi:hypothetical protein